MGNMTHHQHHAVIVDSLAMKMVLFLTENGCQGACCIDYRLRRRERGSCVSHAPAFFSGVDVQEAEEDCLTEATTPTSFEPVSQSQMSTLEQDELAPEEVTPSQEEVSPVDQDTSPAEEVRPPEEEASPAGAEADLAQPKEERDSEKTEEPEGDTDSSNQSVDELLADWREDLEAFQQMEKDEL